MTCCCRAVHQRQVHLWQPRRWGRGDPKARCLLVSSLLGKIIIIIKKRRNIKVRGSSACHRVIKTNGNPACVRGKSGTLAWPKGFDSGVIFIVAVIDSKVNVMFWKRATIISVLRLTATTWSTQQRAVSSLTAMVILKTGYMWVFAWRCNSKVN